MTVTVNGSNGITFNDGSSQTAAASPYTLKNRIINGSMQIDQRNAGASVTGNDNIFVVDRWKIRASQTSKMTAQQNAGSVTPPVGYNNYLGITSSSAYTVTSGDYFWLAHLIEGFNTADLNWGTANAQTVTLSFWVRSSLTGTFGGCLRDGNGGTAQYPFSYTISAANTWEQKTITVLGPTIGTWQTNSSASIEIVLSLGMCSTYSGTAGSWTASSVFAPTGSTSVVGTNGATFYITGVQLEVGSTATPFERRMYGQELALCQRYYQQWGKSSNIAYRPYAVGSFVSTTQARMIIPTMVTMRTAPNFTFNNPTNCFIRLGSTSAAATTMTLDISSPEAIMYNVNIASGGTEGRGTTSFQNDTNSTSLELSAEL
jgi:hypothetical protein